MPIVLGLLIEIYEKMFEPLTNADATDNAEVQT
jgi:hypothetical protein